VVSAVQRERREGRNRFRGTRDNRGVQARTCHGKVMYQALEWFFLSMVRDSAQPVRKHLFRDLRRPHVAAACLSVERPDRKARTADLASDREAALVVDLTNAGPGSCVLDGYPRVFLLAREGNELSLAQVNHSQFITAAALGPDARTGSYRLRSSRQVPL